MNNNCETEIEEILNQINLRLDETIKLVEETTETIKQMGIDANLHFENREKKIDSRFDKLESVIAASADAA
jgi:hypothetical protein